MQYFPWQTSANIQCFGGSVVLGVVFDKTRMSTPEGLLLAQGQLTCAVDGVVSRYRGDGPVDRYLTGEVAFAAAVLEAYRQHGVRFPEFLEGHYTACIADENANKLLVASSRTAFTPLYNYASRNLHFYCSQLGPMAACGVFAAKPDEDAIATILAYGELFEQETLVEGVASVETASVTEIAVGGEEATSRRYWDFRHHGPVLEGKSIQQYADTLCEVLSAAADRKSRMQGRVTIGLSGGYDSRLVAGLLAPRLKGMTAWTFGAENAADLAIAREISGQLGMNNHRQFGVDAADIADYGTMFASTVDGSVTTNWAFAESRKLSIRESADIALNGFEGDIYLAGSMTGGKYRAVKAWLKDRAKFGKSAPAPYLEWNRGPDELARFIGSGTKIKSIAGAGYWANLPAKTLEERALDDFAATMGNVPDWYHAEQWITEHRAQRYTLMSIISDRHYYADDSIFYDYDVLDYCATVPPRMRRGHRVYIRILRKLMPEIAIIANSNTGLSATTPQSVITTHKIASHLWGKLNKNVAAPITDTTALDANLWARSTLREFYGDLVRSPSLQSRPFWDGTGIARRFDEHQDNKVEFGGPLGMIANVELFLRRWVD
jgi:hypothetical protein